MRRCCLTALRKGCDTDLCSISRSGTFGRVSAKSPLITWGACIFVRGGRCLFSKSLTAGDTRVGAIGGQTICVRFGMCLCQNRRGSSVFLHTDADDNRWPSLPSLQPRRCHTCRSQPHYRSPSKVAPEHQRTESPSPPTPPTKLWQLVLLRLLCGSPSAACLPRSPWRGRFSFRWPYETRFRRTFYPPRSRLTRPRVGFCTWSLPTVAVWSQDGSVAVEVDCILEVQHMLDCHHLGIFILIHKTA